MKKMALLLAAVLALQTVMPSLGPVAKAEEVQPEAEIVLEQAVEEGDSSEVVEVVDETETVETMEAMGTQAGEDVIGQFNLKLYEQDTLVEKLPNAKGEYRFIYNNFRQEKQYWTLVPGYMGEGEFDYEVASSNANYLEAAVNTDKKIILTPKDFGEVTITVDVMQNGTKVATKDLLFETMNFWTVYDPNPVELDKQGDLSGTVTARCPEGWTLTSMELFRPEDVAAVGLQVIFDVEKASFEVTANENTTVGEHVVNLLVKFTSDKTTDIVDVNHAYRVKITDGETGSKEPEKPVVAPKTVAKQVYKLNTFYTYGYAQFKMTVTGAEIADAEVVDSEYFSAWYSSYSKLLTIDMSNADFAKLSDVDKKKESKIKVKFTATDGREWTTDITVGYTKVVPKFTLDKTGSTVYLFTDEENNVKKAGAKLSVHLMDKKYPYWYGVEKAELVAGSNQDRKGNVTFAPTSDMTNYSDENLKLDVDENNNVNFYFVGDAAATAKIAIQCYNWTEPVIYTYKVSVSKKAVTAKLSSSKVLVNAHYGDVVATQVKATKTEFEELTLGTPELVSKPKNATYGTDEDDTLKIGVDGQFVYVMAPTSEKMVAGTYKFKLPITLEFEDGISYALAKPLVLTVTVKNQEITAKDLKVKKKGSLSMKKGGSIQIATTIKNVNARPVGMMFSQEDYEETKVADNFNCYFNSWYGINYITLNYSNAKVGKVKVHPIYLYQIEGSEQIIQVPGAPITISIGK